MNRVDVTSQKELDAALAAGHHPILTGSAFYVVRGSFSVTARGSASVEARGSASVTAFGSARVEAWGSASVEARGSARVEAYDSASVTACDSASVEAWGSASVTARGSASVTARAAASVTAFGSARVEAFDSASVEARDSARVEAYDSASVTARAAASVTARDSARVEAFDSASVTARAAASVTAFGSARVEAFDAASVTAGTCVPVQIHHRHSGEIVGGVQIRLPDPNTITPADWCAHNLMAVADGQATVYKAVDASWRSDFGTVYQPGETVTCGDFDTRRECGGGLHFGVTPAHAATYQRDVAHYLECLVDVEPLVPLGDKCKAPSCRVVREVDETGQPLVCPSGSGGHTPNPGSV